MEQSQFVEFLQMGLDTEKGYTFGKPSISKSVTHTSHTLPDASLNSRHSHIQFSFSVTTCRAWNMRFNYNRPLVFIISLCTDTRHKLHATDYVHIIRSHYCPLLCFEHTAFRNGDEELEGSFLVCVNNNKATNLAKWRGNCKRQVCMGWGQCQVQGGEQRLVKRWVQVRMQSQGQSWLW